METRTWSTPECPFTVEYSGRVLDDIRLAVVDAFFSLPRGGAEIGGVLLGRQENGRVTITESVPLPCEHAFGPSFTLSPKDLAKLEAMLPGLRKVNGPQPVGWYHSHTRSELFLSDADQEIHKRFFPEAWQVALVLKPHTFQPTRAGFFFREEGGLIQGAACYREFALDPLPVHQVPQGLPQQPVVAEPEPALRGPVITIAQEGITVEEEDETPSVIPQPEPLPQESVTAEPVQPEPSKPPRPDVISFRPESPRPETPAEAPPAKEPSVEEPPREVAPPRFLEKASQGSSRWPVTALAIVAALGLGAAIYGTRERWIPLWSQLRLPGTAAPAPPVSVGLMVADQQGQLQLQWNRESAAVRTAARGVVTVVDGTAKREIELGRQALDAGSFTYGRQSQRVDVELRLVQPGGAETRETGMYVGALPPSPDSSPDAPAVRPSDPEGARLRTELRTLQEQNRKLQRTIDELRLQLEQRTRLGNQAK
jgi:proteasome lid subunit RPN8/RPN11